MYFLRSLSLPILITLFVSIISSGIAFAEAKQSGGSSTGSYAMGINKFYYGYAWVKNDDPNHGGWYHVWAHVGDGDNDYKGGSYTADFEQYAFSLHIVALNNPNPPSPNWASHDIY